jgi:hypothetical protein
MWESVIIIASIYENHIPNLRNRLIKKINDNHISFSKVSQSSKETVNQKGYNEVFIGYQYLSYEHLIEDNRKPNHDRSIELNERIRIAIDEIYKESFN